MTYKVNSIQHYVINFVSHLRQVGDILWVLMIPPPKTMIALI